MTVADVYRALWRRRFFIALLTVALVAVDALVTSQQTKLYTASALVRVEQKNTTAADQFGSLQTGALLARTYAKIAETSSVADRVKAQLGNSVPGSEIKITAAQVSDVELLQLSATNANPKLAARIANAVPTALTNLVKQGGPSPDVITTVDRASPPTSPSSPNMKLNVAIGFIIGLILNSGIVLLAAAFADRVGGADDLEHLTSLPVIATVPTLPLGRVGDLAAMQMPAPVATLARDREREREGLGRGSGG
jgi:capsular polysaccharide biosynthesis protein